MEFEYDHNKNQSNQAIEAIQYEDGRSIILDADDSPPFTDEQWKQAKAVAPSDLLPKAFLEQSQKRRMGRPKAAAPKKHLGVRLDADIVDWLRSQSGYNALINDVLRSKMQREQPPS